MGARADEHNAFRIRPAAVAAVLGSYALAAGSVSFLGWVLDIRRLTAWDGGEISIQPNTALAAAAGGAALILLALGRSLGAAIAGSCAGLIGGTALFEHLSGVDLGIDTLLLLDRPWGDAATLAPGRMGPPGSVSWTLLGFGLVGAAVGGRGWRRLASVAGVIAAGLGSLSVIGYLYGSDPFYSLPRLTAIAFPTATMIVAAAFGLIAAVPDQQPMRTLTSDGASGVLARRAMPLAILLPVAIGWVRVEGQAAGLFDTGFGSAARTVVEAGLLIALLWWAVSMVRAHELALRRSEAEARRQAAQLAAFLDTAAVWLHRVGPDGTILWANEAELKGLGYEAAEYVGHHISEFHASQEAIEDILARLHRGETLREYEARMRCRDGSIKTVLVDSSVLWEEGRFVHTQCFTRDITQAARADEARARLAAIVETSDDAIVSKTLDGVILSWNAGAERLFGYTPAEAVGRSISLIIPPELMQEEEEILARLRRGERIAHFETVRVAKGGRRVDISLAISPVRDSAGRVIAASKVARDITERRRTEEELRRHREHLEQLVSERTAELESSHQQLRTAERLAALGTLSAGLGHDMGNILMPMGVRLETLEGLDLPEEAKREIAGLRASAEYLRRLAAGLRQLAVDPRASPGAAPTELLTWWSDAETVLRNALPPGASLEADLGDAPCWVAMPRPALTQSIFNLAQNAGDAMRAQGGGTVRLSALRAEGFLRLSVADSGPGMTPEVRRRCMEPFFTTKTRGLSTGLGLALVYGLVREAGGSVDVDSEPGKGTVFTLSLPLATPPAPAGAGKRARVEVGDARLRAYITAELRNLSYEVHASRNGGGNRIILESEPPGGGRVVALGLKPTMREVRAAIAELSGPLRG